MWLNVKCDKEYHSVTFGNEKSSLNKKLNIQHVLPKLVGYNVLLNINVQFISLSSTHFNVHVQFC